VNDHPAHVNTSELGHQFTVVVRSCQDLAILGGNPLPGVELEEGTGLATEPFQRRISGSISRFLFGISTSILV